MDRIEMDFRGYSGKQFIRDAIRRAQRELRRELTGFEYERMKDIGRDAEEQYKNYDVRDNKRSL